MFVQFLIDIITILFELISGLHVGIDQRFHDKDMVIQLVIHFFSLLGISNLDLQRESHRNRTMVCKVCCNLTHMSVNNQINW